MVWMYVTEIKFPIDLWRKYLLCLNSTKEPYILSILFKEKCLFLLKCSYAWQTPVTTCWYEGRSRANQTSYILWLLTFNYLSCFRHVQRFTCMFPQCGSFIFQSISRKCPYHGQHFHTMVWKLDFPTFFYNISKIFSLGAVYMEGGWPS